MIGELHGELDKLDRVIAALEELQRVHHSAEDLAIQPRRRGRKSMSAEERRDVSERMKSIGPIDVGLREFQPSDSGKECRGRTGSKREYVATPQYSENNAVTKVS
jgi:hypothetical protein